MIHKAGRRVALRFSVVVILAALSSICRSAADEEEAKPAVLTLKRIFTDEEFKTEDFGPAKWLEDRTGYTTLDDSPDREEAKDIVRYDPQTNSRSILVASKRLIPQGESQPMEIEDYSWSKDGRKLLVFTNTQRVWRTNTRGDYWVLDLETWALHKLGGDVEPSTLMFAKLSPDGERAAYVREMNIYVEDLDSGRIRQLTKDGGGNIINGTSDWVYEEEFGLRDAFRWSPDGRYIAYWQFDTEGVGEFHLINYTDSLYPKITSFQYPKVGQTNPACRIGV
ncbi:MAG: DPP IV N-terminal domain-containing protein, partial [Sedimentisphaerales bacterium]|nr:DPP IV N-terminal domain-containing protein [Sedimentisphaerales bacterium]